MNNIRDAFEAWYANQLWHGMSAHDRAYHTWQAGHAAGVLAERERCARVCETALLSYNVPPHATANDLAAAIRKGTTVASAGAYWGTL